MYMRAGNSRENIGKNMDNYDLHPASETEGFYAHILASWDPVCEDSEWEPGHNKP